MDPAFTKLAVEVADAGEWVGLCVRGLAALGEVGGAEEGRAGEVLDIGAVEQPVVASEDGLMGAGVKVRGEEGLDGGSNLGVEAGGRFELLFECLKLGGGGEMESGLSWC